MKQKVFVVSENDTVYGVCSTLKLAQEKLEKMGHKLHHTYYGKKDTPYHDVFGSIEEYELDGD